MVASASPVARTEADEVGDVASGGGDAGAARQDERCGVVREREGAAELHNTFRTGSDGAQRGDRRGAADDDAVGRGGANVRRGGAGDRLRRVPVEGAGQGVASFGYERACDSGLQCLNFGLCSGEVVANVRR